MIITATEFKEHFGKYLLLAAKEDIYVRKNSKIIAKLSKPSDEEINNEQKKGDE